MLVASHFTLLAAALSCCGVACSPTASSSNTETSESTSPTTGLQAVAIAFSIFEAALHPHSTSSKGNFHTESVTTCDRPQAFFSASKTSSKPVVTVTRSEPATTAVYSLETVSTLPDGSPVTSIVPVPNSDTIGLPANSTTLTTVFPTSSAAPPSTITITSTINYPAPASTAMITLGAMPPCNVRFGACYQHHEIHHSTGTSTVCKCAGIPKHFRPEPNTTTVFVTIFCPNQIGIVGYVGSAAYTAVNQLGIGSGTYAETSGSCPIATEYASITGLVYTSTTSQVAPDGGFIGATASN